MEIVIASSIIIILVTLPVFAWPKSRALSIPVILLLTAFILINRDFVTGIAGAWHDTLRNFQIFFALRNQWADSGVALGWDPYSWGGQPLAILNNYILWAPMAILTGLFRIVNLAFDITVAFNLAWLFINFIFFTGTLLLLQLIYKNYYVSIVGFSALLFSDFFNANLGQATGISTIFLLPYILFFFLYSFQTGRWNGLFFFSFLLGVAFNGYLPTYISLTIAAVFLVTAFAFPKKIFQSAKLLLKKRFLAPLFCILLFLISTGPVIYSYHEMKDYVSPRRGFTQGGFVASSTNILPPTEAGFSSYTSLFNRKNSHKGLDWIHNAFYIGIIPLLFLSLAMFSAKGRIFLISGVILAILSLGYKTFLWGWMTQHIPLLNITRQTFIFTQIAGFLVLLGSMSGLKLFLAKFGTPRKIIIAIIPILLLHFFDMVPFAIDKSKKLHPASGCGLNEIRYPFYWRSVDEQEIQVIPFDHRPLINKESFWTTRTPEHMFFMQKDFAGFINTYLIAEKFPITGNIFYLLPNRQSWKMDVSSLRNILDIPLLFFCSTEASSYNNPWESPDKAIDADPNTYWHITLPRQTNYSWIAISAQIPITFDTILITPRQRGFTHQLWERDHAELQTSKDGLQWTTVSKLDLKASSFDGSNKPIIFQLKDPVTTQSVRININDERFASLAEIEFTGPDDLKNKSASLGSIEEKLSRDPNRVSMSIDAKQDVYLLRMENFHKNWKAFIDGKQIFIEKVAPNFQMIAVPAGRHEVSFVFHSLYPLLVNLHTLCVILAWFAILLVLGKESV